MALFHIYVDESGKLHANTDFTCLCGYLAPGATWEVFSQNWNGCRLRWGVPPLHMAQIMKPVGASSKTRDADWDAVRQRWGSQWESIRNEMLEEFARIISSLPIVAIGAVVDANAYRSLKSESSPITEQDPNVFAFHNVIMDGLRTVERVTNLGSLSIIVDDDPEFAHQYYDLAQGLRNHPEKSVFSCVRDRLDAICFGDDRAYPGLQAADLLCWTARRFMIDRKSDEDNLPSNLLRLLTFDGLHQPKVWTREALAELSDKTTDALKENPS